MGINMDKDKNYKLDDSKVGEIEDEKIRLSYLRSTHASETTLILSDIEATDLEYYKTALAESRKMFSQNNDLNQNGGNQQLDAAIKKSLAQYEHDAVENAKQISMKEQEDIDLALALKKSQYDFTFGGINDNLMMNDNNNLNGNFNNDNIGNIVDQNDIIGNKIILR